MLTDIKIFKLKLPYIHTYIHTDTYIHKFRITYIHTLLTDIKIYTYIFKLTYIHTYRQTDTYIHKLVNTYIHTYNTQMESTQIENSHISKHAYNDEFVDFYYDF